MKILDGKIASAHYKEEIKQRVYNQRALGKRPPGLAAILVGTNGASETYVASKVKSCEEIGFHSVLIRMESEVSEETLVNEINRLNADNTIDGILVQLPLPEHIRPQRIIQAISPQKDVDGFHPESMGQLALGSPTFIPATPFGIILLLNYFKIPTAGKHVVVLGRSNIVGRPISILLNQPGDVGDATVTACHSRSENLTELCASADILIAAIGKPGFVTANMVKIGATVIDVGITRVPDDSKKSGFRICGDVDFAAVEPIAGHITPVPGGVGLMTIAALLENTFRAYMNHQP
jgi:methylenetetrahydrofolate dehydrogenase (NADP+)/methenyltetrahydrofolate cyclohydrolase